VNLVLAPGNFLMLSYLPCQHLVDMLCSGPNDLPKTLDFGLHSFILGKSRPAEGVVFTYKPMNLECTYPTIVILHLRLLYMCPGPGTRELGKAPFWNSLNCFKLASAKPVSTILSHGHQDKGFSLQNLAFTS
jgi:hypothetical protein